LGDACVAQSQNHASPRPGRQKRHAIDADVIGCPVDEFNLKAQSNLLIKYSINPLVNWL
jgi:ectoine hydroxylase-related dioxygenase (phytanoyl-CoA dioxygenase family)